MKNRFLECGKIVTIHGLKGDVKVQPWTDTPDFLVDFEYLYFKDGKEKLEIQDIRVQKNMLLIKFVGIDTLESASALRGRVLYIDRQDVEIEEGWYFFADLIGLDVYNLDIGKYYGKIVDITQTGANDVYHIKSETGELRYIPAIPEVVASTDIDNGKMMITPLKGLFDDED